MLYLRQDRRQQIFIFQIFHHSFPNLPFWVLSVPDLHYFLKIITKIAINSRKKYYYCTYFFGGNEKWVSIQLAYQLFGYYSGKNTLRRINNILIHCCVSILFFKNNLYKKRDKIYIFLLFTPRQKTNKFLFFRFFIFLFRIFLFGVIGS